MALQVPVIVMLMVSDTKSWVQKESGQFGKRPAKRKLWRQTPQLGEVMGV